jgi:hypothetical protein
MSKFFQQSVTAIDLHGVLCVKPSLLTWSTAVRVESVTSVALFFWARGRREGSYFFVWLIVVPFNNVCSDTEYILGTNYRTEQSQVLSFQFNLFPDFLLSLFYYRNCVGPLMSFLNRQFPSSCSQPPDYKDVLLKLFGRQQFFFHKNLFNNERKIYFFRIFLDAFAKLRKGAVSFVMSVHPSVRIEQLGSHWTNFHETLIWVFFENLLKSDKNRG